MKRWPNVTSPLSTGPKRNGTTSPSSRQRIACSGRTQRVSPEPQRIDLGQGKRRRCRGSASASTSAVARPRSRSARTRTRPSCPRAPRCSMRRARRACQEAVDRLLAARRRAGPCSRLARSGWLRGTPSTTSVSRRGVAKDADARRTPSAGRGPARRRPGASGPRRARSCIRAGISSENSSSSSSGIGPVPGGLVPAAREPGLGSRPSPASAPGRYRPAARSR